MMYAGNVKNVCSGKYGENSVKLVLFRVNEHFLNTPVTLMKPGEKVVLEF